MINYIEDNWPYILFVITVIGAVTYCVDMIFATTKYEVVKITDKTIQDAHTEIYSEVKSVLTMQGKLETVIVPSSRYVPKKHFLHVKSDSEKWPVQVSETLYNDSLIGDAIGLKNRTRNHHQSNLFFHQNSTTIKCNKTKFQSLSALLLLLPACLLSFAM